MVLFEKILKESTADWILQHFSKLIYCLVVTPLQQMTKKLYWIKFY